MTFITIYMIKDALYLQHLVKQLHLEKYSIDIRIREAAQNCLLFVYITKCPSFIELHLSS